MFNNNYKAFKASSLLTQFYLFAHKIRRLCGLTAQVLIIPFATGKYSWDNLLKFDLLFSEQFQIMILFSVLFLSLFNFAAAQDGGYADEKRIMMSQRGRLTFDWTVVGMIYMFMASVLISEVAGKRLAATFPHVARVSEQIRGNLRTLKQAKLAPFVQGSFIIMIMMALVIPIAGIVSFAISDKSAVHLEMLNSFARQIVYCCAGFFMCGNPKNGRKGSVIFVASVALSIITSYTLSGLISFTERGKILMSSDSSNLKYWTWWFWLPFSLLLVQLLFRCCVGARKFIATHSDAQIDKHLISGLQVFFGAFAPVVFLVAESASCVVTEEDYRDCSILVSSNLLVTSQLLASAIIYLLAGVANQHLTYVDTVALRNVDAGYIAKLFALGVTWACALAAFGARPREIIPGSYNAGLSEIMETVIKGITITLYTFYAIIVLWEINHVKFKIRLDLQLSGVTEKDTNEHREVRRIWFRLWERLNALVAAHAVGVEDARSSSLFVWIAIAIIWLIVSQIYLSLAIFAISGPDNNEAYLFFSLYKSNEYLMWPCISAMLFLDLRPPSERKDSGNRNLRRILVSVTLVLVLGAIGLIAALPIYMLPKNVGTDVFIAAAQIALLATIAYAHRSALKVESKEARHNHVYNVVYPKTLQLAFPFIIICAEMMACWIEEYSMLADGDFFRDDPQCAGLSLGSIPLVLFMLCAYYREVRQGRGSDDG